MKHPIEWHKMCLKNQKSSLEEKRKDMERANESFYSLRDDIGFYQHQIFEAQGHNKDGFDRDRYLVKKKTLV